MGIGAAPQIDRYRQAMGAQFDQKMFETPEAKQAILDNLIAERALNAEVARNHLTITDATLAKVYAEQFQRRRRTQYKAAAAAHGPDHRKASTPACAATWRCSS